MSETTTGPFTAVRGIRGATTAEANTTAAIVSATRELLLALAERNRLVPDDLAAILFTCTPDLDAAFPAQVARDLGWGNVPLLGAQEMGVPGGPPRCLRILILVNTARNPSEIRHVYLRGAQGLRPDLAGPAQGGNGMAHANPTPNASPGHEVKLDASDFYQPDPPRPRISHMALFQLAKALQAKGRRVYHLELGEPDFAPPAKVATAVTAAIRKGFTRYTETRGIPEIREALANDIRRRTGYPLSEEQVILTPGGRFAVYAAVVTSLQPGDEAIVVEPAWPAYRESALRAGARVVTLRTSAEEGWQVDPARVEKLITPSTRLLAINTPNNPTGAVIDRKRMERLVAIANAHKLLLISDEVYEDYCFAPFTSSLSCKPDRPLLVGSFSKSFSMTGFRVGFAAGDLQTIRNMASLQSLSITSVAEFIQHAALAALRARKETNRYRKTIRARLDAVLRALRQAPEGVLRAFEPQGGMYVWLQVLHPGFQADEFAEALLREDGVAVAPGTSFGEFPDCLRIAVGRPEKELTDGVRLLLRRLEKLPRR